MSRRKKNGGRPQGDPIQLTERSLQKRDFRQALKYARVAVRKSPGEATQRLLERTSMARADELLRKGHIDQARDLLVPIAGTTRDPKLKEDLPDVLLRAGLVDQFPEFRTAISEAERKAFEIVSFDQAVVDIDKARTADVREQARLIRSALQAVEAGDDSLAKEHLRGIPRKSLAADWRFFVRGIMAWYANDGDAVDANWSRLESDRAASRIVGQLTGGRQRRETLPSEVEGRPSGESPTFGVRADAVLPSSVIRAVPALRSTDGLQQVLLELANEDWSAVLTAFRKCRSVLREKAPQLFDRIAAKIVERMIRADDRHAMEEFCRRVGAPSHDPNWNLARATLSEREFYEGARTFEAAENCWLQCLRDIDHTDHFSEPEKQIARALLKTRIGHLCVVEIRDIDDCFHGVNHDDEIGKLRERAAEFLEHAIGVCPTCVDPWQELIQLYDTVDDPTALAATRQRMLAEFPDDFDMLEDAATSALNGGDPLQGRDYLLRALRIKPLDERLGAQMMAAHRECARTLIRNADFDAARSELDASVAADGGNEMYHVNHFVLRAVLELSAGNDMVAEGLIRDAMEVCTESTAVNLDLAIEAAQVDLPQDVIQPFEDAWRANLGKKRHSQTAGRMARLLSPEGPFKFAPPEDYKADVLAYLKRSHRVRFTSIDLRRVCVFLQVIHEPALLDRYVRKGCKRFPDEPLFPLIRGETEMAKGPGGCRRKIAFDAYTRVLAICGQSADESHQRMAESARENLSFLNEKGLKAPQKSRLPPSFFTSGPPKSAEELQELLERTVEESGMSMSELVTTLEAEVNLH